MRIRSRVAVGSVAAAVFLGPALTVPAAAHPQATYEVTITSLIPGQPLTPPVVATHSDRVKVFKVGRSATFEVKEIAENGNTGPLASLLEGGEGVADVFSGTAPLVAPGVPGASMFADSVVFTLEADRGARFLSWVSMLICTNDGFSGVDGLRLPSQIGQSVTVGTAGYDAGTEINTEDFADIVPPCQGLVGVSSGEAGTGTSNPALFEGGRIHHHEGIQGVADLVAIHAWDVKAPVAVITVERIA